MSELEKRIGNVEAIQDINQCLTRYCRALDWGDEDLLKSCFLENGHIDYGFYVGDAKGFIPVVMEVERNSHTWHNISNVAIELKDNKAEVESYGFTAGGEVIDNQIKDIISKKPVNTFTYLVHIPDFGRYNNMPGLIINKI